MKRKNKEESVDISILEGLEVSDNFYKKNENRLLTLFLKGILVYLITAGMFGCALTATKTGFNEIWFNIVVFVLSLVISVIYYNKKSENIGDIVYLIMLIFVGLYYAPYINTGFYTWMNDIIGAASIYFDLPDIGGYLAQLKDVQTSVTFAACYLGSVGVIIVNMSLIKKMHTLDILVDAIIIIMLPAYLELEPGFIYTAMLIMGIALSIVWRSTGRYEKTDNNSIYIKKKNEITYTYDLKAHLMAFGQIGTVVLAIIILIYVIFPAEDYRLVRTRSDSKEYTDDIFETFITSGISGFFNRYENNGGIKSGKLGGVNSIRLDYQTDLIVTYVPYDYSPVYLRTFVGGTYAPYENCWYLANNDNINRDEYINIKAMYENGDQYTAKAKMKIRNISAETGEFALYYADKHKTIHNASEYEGYFYPRFEETAAYGQDISLSEEEKTYWLQIPNDNRPSVMNFVNKLGIEEGMDPIEAAETIRIYYLNNIPYTLRPGATPRNRDFVNYFLDNNRKGYCVHFASAGVLALRQIGIPARYVEGYAFDYLNVLDSEAVLDADTEDYFEGYNALPESGVVEVELSDANAHAWIEMYTDEYGWIPIELTPPSSDIERNDRSLFERFIDVFSNNQAVNSPNIGNTPQFDNTKLRLFFIIVIFLCLAIVFVKTSYMVIKDIIVYSKADINTKLVLKYHNYLRRNERRFDKLKECCNYRDQIEYLSNFSVNGSDKEEIIAIMEKAGFSDETISKAEFDKAVKYMSKRLHKDKRSTR